jgi:hypothetical protein
MQTGDLIFSFIGSEDNAISGVTEGYRGARVNHVGVLTQTSIGFFVLEAFPPEVRLTHIDVFSRRSNDPAGLPRIMIGRLQTQFHNLIPAAMEYGIARRNIPYDRLYLTGEQALYCSELVVDMFKFANKNTEFFPENPMSFRDHETGLVHPTWTRYYSYYGMNVPEGEPGSNPGDMSKDSRLEIYKVEGNIPGYAG